MVDTLRARDITVPTPIQAATLPDSLAGKDVLGRGRTGSGKSYAFLLPMVARLAGKARDMDTGAAPRKARPGHPRALILAPTRELVSQLDEALAPLAAVYSQTSRTIFGGVGQNPQVAAIRRGVDVLVACPGRLEDLIRQGHVDLDQIEITILDEADHMADLGFLPAVRRLLDRTPRHSQRMLFSATLDNAVNQLVARYLHNPVTHEADSAQSPVAAMTHHVLHVHADDHLKVLLDLAAAPGRTVVFTRTKHRAKKFTRQLNAAGVPAVELHGNLSQNARTRTMTAFQEGAAQTLVATDIAARGIHVDDVGLVIHADPPVEHKAYLHRSGRTARAGNEGTVITLMTDDQVSDVRALTRKAGIKPTTTRVKPDHPILTKIAPGERAFTGAFVPEVPSQPQSTGSTRPRRASQSSRSNQSSRSSHSGRPAQGGPRSGRGGGSASQSNRSSGAERRSPSRQRAGGTSGGRG